jgi:FkbM family methyltransferase
MLAAAPVLRRLNLTFAQLLAAVVERRPGLEQFMSDRAAARRLSVALTRLQRAGVRLETVYDIGAHRGDWTRAIRPALPDARFFLFEANPTHARELEQTGERHFIATLSSAERTVNFYGTGGSGDSYYRETTPRYATVAPMQVQSTTLDVLVERFELPLPDLIKADVQGAELDVLRGGTAALGNAKLVLLECPVSNYNEGAPSFGEYFAFLEERGFTPIEFLEAKWLAGRMMQIDVLFADVEMSRS